MEGGRPSLPLKIDTLRDLFYNSQQAACALKVARAFCHLYNKLLFQLKSLFLNDQLLQSDQLVCRFSKK